MTANSRIRMPRTVSTSYRARQVAQAYNYPLQYTGKGQTCGIIELGGGFGASDLTAAGVDPSKVRAVSVAGGRNAPDGPNGADGEVLLDIEVVAGVAPNAAINVYFAPNTDAGFLAAVERATQDKVTVLSISWGGPESSWTPGSMDQFDAAFHDARAAGVIVFCASGDNGSNDGTSRPVADFPASSPNVVGCGGTRLTLNTDGTRATEVTWDDNDTSSATGGGVSQHFPGRQVPDVAGDADPQTGYQVVVDGQDYVIGGTSAVAPLYAGLVLLLSEAIGAPLGTRVDFMNTLLTNLGVCYDVTAGDNGAYRAGPGRDNVTGLGVVDGGKLLTVLTDTTTDPGPPPGPVPIPVPDDPAVALAAALRRYANHYAGPRYLLRAAAAWLASRP